MKTVYVGIDLGSKVCVGTARDSMGNILNSRSFGTSEKNLIDYVAGQKGKTRVLMEECELAGWVYRTLLPNAESVEVCDPKRNAWISRSERKDDRVDSRKLSEQLRIGSYSVIYHPEEDEMAAFKISVQHYDKTVKRSTKLKLQIKATLRGQGVMTTTGHVYGRTGREKAIEKVKHPAIREILVQDLELLDQLMKEKQQARSRVIRISKKFPVTERFKKIPGIGPILAAQFVAFVQNPHRFNKRRLWAFSRLGIAKRSSDGVNLGPERLSRSGNGSMKDLSRKAYEAAMRTRDPNGIKTFYGRSLSRTGDPNHARLNTQRKILAIMLAMWRDGTEYSDDLVLGKRA